MKDIWLTFNALRSDAMDRGMLDLAVVYGNSAVRMGFEIIADFERTRTVYDQMDRDLGDMIK